MIFIFISGKKNTKDLRYFLITLQLANERKSLKIPEKLYVTIILNFRKEYIYDLIHIV